jgi:hypothetical protein
MGYPSDGIPEVGTNILLEICAVHEPGYDVVDGARSRHRSAIE